MYKSKVTLNISHVVPLLLLSNLSVLSSTAKRFYATALQAAVIDVYKRKLKRTLTLLCGIREDRYSKRLLALIISFNLSL